VEAAPVAGPGTVECVSPGDTMLHLTQRPRFGATYRRLRGGKVGLVGTILLVILAIGGYFANVFVPPYWTHQEMRQLTESVALDWAALNRGKAERRIGEEFRRKEVPNYIADDACKLEERGPNKIVSCAWAVDVFYPPTDYYKTLSFTTRCEVDQHGNVVSEE
jgi:hypothetical protein